MKTIYSPSNIEVLLHFHCGVGPHPREEAEAVQEAIDRFIQDDVIAPEGEKPGVFRTTKKGQAWVQALCNVEPPKPAWVDSHGNILLVCP